MARQLRQKVKSNKARVLDLCCGVGTSTRALRDAFPEAEAVIGMDTSLEMISMANFLAQHKKKMTKGVYYKAATFTNGNAE